MTCVRFFVSTNGRFAAVIRDLEKIFRKPAKYTAPETLLMV